MLLIIDYIRNITIYNVTWIIKSMQLQSKNERLNYSSYEWNDSKARNFLCRFL